MITPHSSSLSVTLHKLINILYSGKHLDKDEKLLDYN